METISEEEAPAGASPRRLEAGQQPERITLHVYTAIRLTNYFANLLNQNPPHRRGRKHGKPGDEWRTRQLARQMPQQDLKLLASPEKPQDAHHKEGAAGDEIKFIRGQTRLASQFRASLYYLNPSKQVSGGQVPRPECKSKSWTQRRRQLELELEQTCFKVSSTTPAGV